MKREQFSALEDFQLHSKQHTFILWCQEHKTSKFTDCLSSCFYLRLLNLTKSSLTSIKLVIFFERTVSSRAVWLLRWKRASGPLTHSITFCQPYHSRLLWFKPKMPPTSLCFEHSRFWAWRESFQCMEPLEDGVQLSEVAGPLIPACPLCFQVCCTNSVTWALPCLWTLCCTRLQASESQSRSQTLLPQAVSDTYLHYNGTNTASTGLCF